MGEEETQACSKSNGRGLKGDGEGEGEGRQFLKKLIQFICFLY